MVIHLMVVLAAMGWTNRAPDLEKPDQPGIPVEFVLNTLPTEVASLPAPQNLAPPELENDQPRENKSPSKTPLEKKAATSKNTTPSHAQGTARGVAAPAPQGNPRPEYPDFARRKGWQGECLLRVVVSPEGKADAVSVHRSSGYAILDQSAAAAVRRWKFLPRVIGGQRLGSTIEVPVNFSLLEG
jgi:protein TonB